MYAKYHATTPSSAYDFLIDGKHLEWRKSNNGVASKVPCEKWQTFSGFVQNIFVSSWWSFNMVMTLQSMIGEVILPEMEEPNLEQRFARKLRVKLNEPKRNVSY